MLLKLFKGTGPGVIFLIFVILSAVWVSAFLNPAVDVLPLSVSEADTMPLYYLLKQVMGNNHFAGAVFSLVMASLLAFLMVNFNTTVFFINERTFLPALILILFGGLFPEYKVLNPVLPASLFLMLAIIRITDGYRKPGTISNFFDAAILISTGSLFYANLIWFGLLVIIGIALLRAGDIMEIAISILGLVTPYLIAFGLYYVLGRDLMASVYLVEDNLFCVPVGYSFTRVTIITLILAGIIVLLSLVFLFMGISNKKIKARKTFYLLFWVFLIAMSIYFILPSVSVEIVWIVAIPVSYFLTHYLIFSKRKLIPEILFSVFLILVLIIQILDFM